MGIRLRFHNHTPQQLAIRLALHQQAADELGGNLLGGAGEEGWGEMLWQLLGEAGRAWWLWEWLGGWVEVIGIFEAKGFERVRSQAMQLYAYPHKPQVGHQVEISLIRGHPKRWHIAD